MIYSFVRKLRQGAQLTAEDEQVLRSLAQPFRNIGAREDIASEGSKARALPLIVDGWACRYRLLENGKRQIIYVFLPGDLCEPFGVLPRFLDHAIATLTPVVYSPIPLGAIRTAAHDRPRIDEALWWDLLVASAIEREHVVSLGRRIATERLGHFFCELYFRLEMVGQTQGFSYELPLTQADLADVLGLSTVHVNRSLQELRQTGLISLRAHRLTIHDLDGLRELSFFDPSYLRPVGSASR